ncbi:hypothetical protein ABB02_00695 [Clostridiaceae bacterium JG1575]|nr:hypothetical protein ABB02_00695 [Clostridiaceae bacterium JG1575]
MNNQAIYERIFRSLFMLEDKDFESDYTFADHDNWDSMAHLQLISELEDHFDVLFDSEDILGFGSYQNGMKILRGYGVDI